MAKKRARPPNVAQPFPPPPPPPPPPVNNPYYQKFFADYWKNHSQGYYQIPGGPPPPAPVSLIALPGGEVPLLPLPEALPPPVARPQLTLDPATRRNLTQEEYPCDKADRTTYVLAAPADHGHLSEKQCYVRTRLCEIFLSQQEDVDKPVRGRTAAFVGQVGLRCVFCVPALNSKDRAERAVCYPTGINKFYQTVQDMQHFHFNACPAIPLHVKRRYQSLRGNMNNRRGGGDKMSPKEYWTKCSEEMGLTDHIGDGGTNNGVKLREGHKLVERARLPEYAKELFMPPKKQKKDGKATEVKGNKEDEDEGNGDGKGEEEEGECETIEKSGGEGELNDLEEAAVEVDDQNDVVRC